MSPRGRPRKTPANLPAHIDYARVPVGLYWDASGQGRWFVRDPHPEGRGTKSKTVAGPSARLSDLHAIAEARKGHSQRGTIDYIGEQFRASSEFKALAIGTRRDYAWCAEVLRTLPTRQKTPFGQLQVDKLAVPVIQRLVELLAQGRPESRPGAGDAIPATPSKANHVLRYLRRLCAWGIRFGHCTTNPATGVRQADEAGAFKMPDMATFNAVLAFARERGARKAHTDGSCPPYLAPAMELAYGVRLRGIEVTTLTDAHALEAGIRSNRRKGSRDNVTEWDPRLRAAWDALQAQRKAAVARSRRPVPLQLEQRFLFVAQDGAPLTKSAFDSAWQRLMALAVKDGVITDEQRFTLHGLKHRGITDAEDKASGGHRTEAMRQRYDHAVPLVKPSRHADFSGDFSGGKEKGTPGNP